MATADELRALAERVMALTGACRETDLMIAATCGIGGVSLMPALQGVAVLPPPPVHTFTASLAAAMTLAKMCERPLSVLRWAMDMLQHAGADIDALPRYVTAAALLALAAQMEGNDG